jgi:hypothetical protein
MQVGGCVCSRARTADCVSGWNPIPVDVFLHLDAPVSGGLRVSAATVKTHVSGRPGRLPFIEANRIVRASILQSLRFDAPPASWRVMLHFTCELVGWSRAFDLAPFPQAQAACGRMHRATVSAAMNRWHTNGVWEYRPARFEGEYGTVAMLGDNETSKTWGFRRVGDGRSRDEMRVVWGAVRRAGTIVCGWPGAVPASAIKVLLAVIAGGACWSRLSVAVSHAELMETTRCSEGQVRNALRWLHAAEVIEYTPGTGHAPSQVRLIAPVEALPSPFENSDVSTVENTFVCVEKNTPGCRPDGDPSENREHDVQVPLELKFPESSAVRGFDEPVKTVVQVAPFVPEPSETPACGGRFEKVCADLSVATGQVVSPDRPGSVRLARAVNDRPGWSVAELVAVAAMGPNDSLLCPAAVYAWRIEQQPVLSPSDRAAHVADAALQRRQADIEARHVQQAVDAAENQVLAPWLARVDALNVAQLEEAICRLPGRWRQRYRQNGLDPFFRSGLTHLLAADDGIDLETEVSMAADQARLSVQHPFATMTGREQR